MTEHLPIKQYGARGPLSDPPILGEYIMVTYDDHLAALAAAREWQIVSNALGFKMGLAAGIKDGLDDARDAVAGHPLRGLYSTITDQFVAAIDALRKDQP